MYSDSSYAVQSSPLISLDLVSVSFDWTLLIELHIESRIIGGALFGSAHAPVFKNAVLCWWDMMDVRSNDFCDEVESMWLFAFYTGQMLMDKRFSFIFMHLDLNC